MKNVRTMYAVIEADFNRNTGEENGDSQVTWFENLEEANRMAAYLWKSMSKHDQEKTKVSVLDCGRGDFEDIADTDTWTGCGGYMDSEMLFSSEIPFNDVKSYCSRLIGEDLNAFGELSFKCSEGDSEYNSFSGILFGNDECFDGDEFYQWLIDENRNLYKVYYDITEGVALDDVNYHNPKSIYFQNEIVG